MEKYRRINKRYRAEVRELVQCLVDAGWAITLFDSVGFEDMEPSVFCSTDLERIVSESVATDVEFMDVVHDNGDMGRLVLIYGNDWGELVADWATSSEQLETLLREFSRAMEQMELDNTFILR